jgi:NADH-quinone oxidoreductase subunit F
MEKILLPEIENLHLIDTYVSNGGYNAAKKAFSQTPDEIIDQVKKSGLRGRGGAAFLAGLKWSFMPKTTDKPKYLCVNGDESEPGSFKDRQIFEFNPHQMIEGTIITCYAIGAKTAYVYIRGEYQKWICLLQKASRCIYLRRRVFFNELIRREKGISKNKTSVPSTEWFMGLSYYY